MCTGKSAYLHPSYPPFPSPFWSTHIHQYAHTRTYIRVAITHQLVDDLQEFPAHDGVSLDRHLGPDRPEHGTAIVLKCAQNSIFRAVKENDRSTVTTSSPHTYVHINWQTALNNGSTFHLTFHQWQSDCQKPFQKLFNHNHLTYKHEYKSTSKTMYELYTKHVLYMCIDYHI